MVSRKHGYLYLVLTVLTIALLIGLAVLRIYFTASIPSPPAKAVSVYAVEVRSDTVVAGRDYIATVQPVARSVISGQVQARVEKIYVDEGDLVEKDTLLAALDDRELETGNQAARARVEALEQELNSLQTQLNSAAADKNYQENELERYRTLFKKGLVARSQLEKIETEATRALENHRGLQARINRLKNEIEAAGSEKEKARLVSEYTQIKAQDSGTVERIHVEEGDLASPGKPLFNIDSAEGYKIVFHYPQEDSKKITEQTPVIINFSEKRTGYATISKVFPALSAQAMGRAEINLKKLPGAIKSGHTLLVRVLADQKYSTSVIPESTIIRRNNESYVYLISDGRLKRQKIETGISDGKNTAVKSGLESGQLIASGAFLELQRHFDGQPALIFNEQIKDETDR
ncbi:MAG: efflux RND transporter periplasmic adaptor subunit [bacterium]